MPPTLKTDWSLLWTTLKKHAAPFFTMLGMGLLFGLVGAASLLAGFDQIGLMLFGGLFALIGLALMTAAVIFNYSSVTFYYGQGLLRKYGVDVSGVLRSKTAECYYHQEYDHNNKPIGQGHHVCHLMVNYEFQLDGKSFSGAYYVQKSDLFDKLQEGETVPLRVLRFDPTVHKVRERKLSNALKNRKPDLPSAIPEGAEITQAV